MSSLAPSNSPRRKRGAQPGNKNAFKHGLYSNARVAFSTLTPAERDGLHDIKGLIKHVKAQMEHLYQVGMNTQDITEANRTMGSMAAAAISLVRLLKAEDEYSRLSSRLAKTSSPDPAILSSSLLEKLDDEMEELRDAAEIKDLLAGDGHPGAGLLDSLPLFDDDDSLSLENDASA